MNPNFVDVEGGAFDGTGGGGEDGVQKFGTPNGVDDMRRHHQIPSHLLKQARIQATEAPGDLTAEFSSRSSRDMPTAFEQRMGNQVRLEGEMMTREAFERRGAGDGAFGRGRGGGPMVAGDGFADMGGAGERDMSAEERAHMAKAALAQRMRPRG